MRLHIVAGQKRIFSILLGFLLLGHVVFAQDFSAAKPESVGLSSERLERIGGAVQRCTNSPIRRSTINFCHAAIR